MLTTGITFNNVKKKHTHVTSIYGYPFTGEQYNSVWNLKLKLPLYTKKEDSKSWFAAGYYSIKIKGRWRAILAPKLIILQRNNYKGPFRMMPAEYDSY